MEHALHQCGLHQFSAYQRFTAVELALALALSLPRATLRGLTRSAAPATRIYDDPVDPVAQTFELHNIH